LNNKLTSTTIKISTIFLAIVLVTGTIALASSQSSFMVGTNAQAQPYYGGGMDNRYDDRKSYVMDSYGSSNYGNDNSYKSQYQPSYKPDYKPQYQPSYGKDNDRDKSQKDIKSVSINKLNCINTNININGNNTGNINLGNKGKAAAEEGGYVGAYSAGSDGYGGSDEGYYDNGYDNKKKDKGFTCTINNNNTNTNIGGDGNQTIPPEPPKAKLNVTKLVTCEERKIGGNNDIITPVLRPTCTDLLGNITEDQFNITVTDTNVSPSSFNGSETGTIVTLDAGSYTVTEDPDETSIAADKATLGGNITGPNISFPNGDCTQTGANSTSATGTIAAGEEQDCNIENQFVITERVRTSVFTADSPMIAQGIGDSSSAIEKMTKLKQQWLDLLP
jgi:hypothetical protein